MPRSPEHSELPSLSPPHGCQHGGHPQVPLTLASGPHTAVASTLRPRYTATLVTRPSAAAALTLTPPLSPGRYSSLPMPLGGVAQHPPRSRRHHNDPPVPTPDNPRTAAGRASPPPASLALQGTPTPSPVSASLHSAPDGRGSARPVESPLVHGYVVRARATCSHNPPAGAVVTTRQRCRLAQGQPPAAVPTACPWCPTGGAGRRADGRRWMRPAQHRARPRGDGPVTS